MHEDKEGDDRGKRSKTLNITGRKRDTLTKRDVNNSWFIAFIFFKTCVLF